MTKIERHEAIRERAREAIRNLYHNATPSYPRIDDDALGRRFDCWLSDTAQFEIEYIADGGAYGSNYRKTLAASCNAGRYKSEAAQRYYIRKGMRSMEEDRSSNAWERITEFGKLYTWGRGGRTLAPDDLVKQRGGGSFSVREDYADEMSIARVVDLIRVVESFNRFVEDWCKSVPEQWAEYLAEEAAEEKAAKQRAAQAKAKETRERNYWAARDVVTR